MKCRLAVNLRSTRPSDARHNRVICVDHLFARPISPCLSRSWGDRLHLPHQREDALFGTAFRWRPAERVVLLDRACAIRRRLVLNGTASSAKRGGGINAMLKCSVPPLN